jgi:hypothetical protein
VIECLVAIRKHVICATPLTSDADRPSLDQADGLQPVNSSLPARVSLSLTQAFVRITG